MIISPSISAYSLSALQFLASPSSNSHYITWSKISKRDLDNYKDMVSQCLPTLPSDVLNCSSTDCTHHMESLDNYAHQFISILIDCGLCCLPCNTRSFTHRFVDWKDGVGKLKEATNFWHKVWLYRNWVSFIR